MIGIAMNPHLPGSACEHDRIRQHHHEKRRREVGVVGARRSTCDVCAHGYGRSAGLVQPTHRRSAAAGDKHRGTDSRHNRQNDDGCRCYASISKSHQHTDRQEQYERKRVAQKLAAVTRPVRPRDGQDR